MNNIDIQDFTNTIIPGIQKAILQKANAQNITLTNDDLATLTTNVLIANTNPASLHDTLNDYITDVFDQTSKTDQPVKLLSYQANDYENLNN